ncbi:MAG: S8 family serine peptidase [Myxococcota bacterium]
MVVAAGNSNANACGNSPARSSNALTVGATTDTDTRSSFSNFGTCLDVFAPGSSITAAWYTSNSALNTISGTSMASPHVAGVAALYRQENPGASASTVFSAVLGNATAGVIANVGSGSPNLFLHSLFGGGGSPPPPPPPPSSPCSGASCEDYQGSLSGTGDWGAQPNGSYFLANAGTHYGWLEGPPGTDFDLELRRWNGRGWSRVDRSISATSSESVQYTGSSGYYYWRISSYSGSGSYDFWMIRP